MASLPLRGWREEEGPLAGRNEKIPGGVSLPVTDADGFYEIRFESIGGLGAHLAGQILAEAGVLRAGLNGAHFSSYGSEKKGTPVKSFVRFCAPDRQVRVTAPVQHPHLVAVFHEGLLRQEPVANGLGPGGILLVNSRVEPEEVRRRLGFACLTVGTVDALGIAVEERTRVNTAMLGAVTRAMGFLPAEAVRETIRATFQRKYPQLVEANLRTFQRGYDELRLVPPAAEEDGCPDFVPGGPLYGYRNAPLGGAVTNPGNTVLKDLSVSRQGFLPVFLREKCVDCGLCDAVCPDMCFVWETVPDARRRRRLAGIDYQYCKGCLKCVEICPVAALVQEREEEGLASARRVPLRLAPAAEEPAGEAAVAVPAAR